MAIQVSKKAARRFLLAKSGLNNYGALDSNVATALRQLECVQLDPVAIIERNHHLVFFNRLEKYNRQELERQLWEGHAFEYFANAACLLPMEDYPIFKGKIKTSEREWASKRHLYQDVERMIRQALADQGPLPSKAFASDKKVVGAWDQPTHATTKETSHVLRVLFETGAIQVCGRQGSERYFALSEDVIPAAWQQEAEAISEKEADRRLVHKYLRAYRLIDDSDPRFGWQRMTAKERKDWVDGFISDGTLTPVDIEGATGRYTVLQEEAEQLLAYEAHNERVNNAVSFLPPLDNLLWRRTRLEDLFDFTYRWEIYIPQHKRRYGPYALPILLDDQLIGRADPFFDRDHGRFSIHVHEEPSRKWSKTRAELVERGARRMGERLGAEDVRVTGVKK
ncbi:winged helix-turn-helix domain-containing protein [Salicibibacter cibarius]|uniref:Winged helix-turn-helix domain-containing protein n=1 Tax=Salicibibacter cibarius TaxID=2743000 RepID=A0A7T6Z0V6_9BACI|nr:crosslink repair DNA glycosylase YcaQ family protein [Salicibibacter cibarius]QQK74859.1 winged helix-turn-helix domain-containing protein [Salicibibacter cibarius]